MASLENSAYASRILLPVIINNNNYVPVLIIYAVFTVIIWRNVDFRFTLKTVFSLLTMPLFAFGMIINLWILETLSPSTFDALYEAIEQANGRRGGAVPVFILSVPMGLAMTYAWYRFILYLDSK